jgi:hypothetical protein
MRLLGRLAHGSRTDCFAGLHGLHGDPSTARRSSTLCSPAMT